MRRPFGTSDRGYYTRPSDFGPVSPLNTPSPTHADMTEGEIAGVVCMPMRVGRDILGDGLALTVFLHRRCQSVELVDGEWPTPPPLPPGAIP